ncbi:M23 family metallopeptidase [Modestobacter lacusdianchii]
MTSLREPVGRTRAEDDRVLDAAPATGGWAGDLDGDWDWDDAWAATQPADAPDVTDPERAADQPRRARRVLLSRRPRAAADRAATGRTAADRAADGPAAADRTRRRSLPRPPGRRAPLLLAVAVAGALAASLLGTGASDVPPVASGQDYGLGMADASFSGGVDVAGARGEISQAEAQARLNEIAASRAAREPDFVVPTDGRLTTCFCQRWGTMHWGLDLAAPLGTPILAAADGVVLRAGPASGYGNAVYIQDADGNVQIYGHMKYYSVSAGDVVSAGEQIAKVGNQGQSTGPHLHFEIHSGGMNGKPIDPEAWLNDRGLSVG